MSNPSSVAVVGAGAWGTTLALHLDSVGASVRLVTRDEEQADAIRAAGENVRYLSGVPLAPAIGVTSDIRMAAQDADVVFVVVPTQAVREISQRLRTVFAGNTLVVSCSKGLERDTLARSSEVLSDVGAIPVERIAILSGPNLSGEIVRGLPASAVVASAALFTAETVQSILSSARFRVYTSRDVIGVEIGGALKNVIALGAGVSDGLRMGQNAKAAFITRGLAELTRLGIAAGANPLTFGGLSGLGDLIATCESPLSRNRTFGQLLSEGLSMEDARQRIGHVVEGATTAYAMAELGRRYGVETPIADAIVAVLDGQVSVDDAIHVLLTRNQRAELD